MKKKTGFNFLSAIIAFPAGIALAREYEFENNSFKNPGTGSDLSGNFPWTGILGF